ncbi:MAG: hypothetical protein WCQ21_19895, partial [Verrucomicrobiota bacterium]
ALKHALGCLGLAAAIRVGLALEDFVNESLKGSRKTTNIEHPTSSEAKPPKATSMRPTSHPQAM